jgi:L-ascorbate metabolism protein UlaG (beta-lactamase superfamily)
LPHIDITLVGGPTAFFTLAGLTFITDPTFDGPGEYPTHDGGPLLVKTSGPAISAKDLPHPDVVLLSHDHHADNFDVSGRELASRVETVISTTESEGRVAGVTTLKNWQTIDLLGKDGQTVHVTGVPARHGPVGCEPFVGEVTGFVVHGEGLPTVYVSGDNSCIEHVEDIAARFPEIDLALLFAGSARLGEEVFGNAELTLTADSAAQASEILARAQVVPVHAEGWAHFTETVQDLRNAFAATGTDNRLAVAAPGETISLAFTPR